MQPLVAVLGMHAFVEIGCVHAFGLHAEPGNASLVGIPVLPARIRHPYRRGTTVEQGGKVVGMRAQRCFRALALRNVDGGAEVTFPLPLRVEARQHDVEQPALAAAFAQPVFEADGFVAA